MVQPGYRRGTGWLQIVASLLYEGLSYAPMDTDDFTLGRMMDCWVKIIYRERNDSQNNTELPLYLINKTANE